MIKVSIVVPTYNVSQYLDQCMTSLVNQTLREMEFICINDGSTDNSLEILKRYAAKDSRIKIIDKENGGYGIGMNIGLDNCTGEYVGIVEPDDYVKTNMYGDLYELAKKYDLDLIKADFCRFVHDENGKEIATYNALTGDPSAYNHVVDPAQEPQVFKYIMNTWSGIYKRSFLEEHHIRHNETPGASFQDNGFWFKTFCYAKRMYFVNKPYYMNRRDNPNSSVHNKANTRSSVSTPTFTISWTPIRNLRSGISGTIPLSAIITMSPPTIGSAMSLKRSTWNVSRRNFRKPWRPGS